MIQGTRKTPKKPVEISLEELVKEQQATIEAQQTQIDTQKANIESLQNAIDDLVLGQMKLNEIMNIEN